MKKTVRNFLLLASSAVIITGCASSSDLEDLRYQLRIVNKKLEDMKSTTVGQLQKRQAAASGHMDQLEQDIIELKAQLEESYYLNQKLREQNKELEVAITSVAEQESAKREEALKRLEEQQRAKEVRLVELNTKLQQQQESVKAIQQARILEAERRAKETAIEAELARKRSNAASKTTSYGTNVKHFRATKKKVKRSVVAPPIQKGPSVAKTTIAVKSAKTNNKPAIKQSSGGTTAQPVAPANDYAKAQNLYQRNKYNEAYKLFSQVASNPTSGNNVNARFMMGESLFKQKEYDKAIMQYQKIISQHSTSDKAPAAMLKQAMAFEKLADKDTAKVIYKKLLKKHGSTPEATTAKAKLDTY
ncbi:MAG: tetratricopeptide repeat protein [Desulfobulbaceae bacterium]|nr:tetratricopeptide repeat protein [Desulfobulbaceae bacterium]